jgi:hypothetical protein
MANSNLIYINKTKIRSASSDLRSVSSVYLKNIYNTLSNMKVDSRIKKAELLNTEIENLALGLSAINKDTNSLADSMDNIVDMIEKLDTADVHNSLYPTIAAIFSGGAKGWDNNSDDYKKYVDSLTPEAKKILGLTGATVAGDTNTTATGDGKTDTGSPLTAFALASWFTGSNSATNELSNYNSQKVNMGDYYAKNYFGDYTPEQSRQLGIDEANIAYWNNRYSNAKSEEEATSIQEKLENAQDKFAADKQAMLNKNLTDNGITDDSQRQEVIDAKHDAEVVANDKGSSQEQIDAAKQKAIDLENKYKNSESSNPPTTSPQTTPQKAEQSADTGSGNGSDNGNGSSVQPRATSSTATPVTSAPTTVAPTTAAPTTVAPTTAAPTTVAPTTAAPTTVAPTTVAPTTAAPTTVAPTTATPVTSVPTTPKTSVVIHDNSGKTLTTPMTSAPVTSAPTTVPVTIPKTTVKVATTKTTTKVSNNITSNKSNNGSSVIPIVLGIGAAGAAAVAGTRYIRKKDQEEMYDDDTTSNDNDFSNLGDYDSTKTTVVEKTTSTTDNKVKTSDDGNINDLVLEDGSDIKINNDVDITNNKEELE